MNTTNAILVAAALPVVLGACAGSWRAADFQEALMDAEHAIWEEPAPPMFEVKFETSKGDFIMVVHRAWAPIGADRFYNLVRTGFYDDSRFYRVRAGFIVQFGLPGDPAVTAVWYDLAMPDDPVVETNEKGFVTYAMTGPDTRTTQLYINLDDNTQLDDQGFAPIGRIVEGMAVVERLYAEYDESAGGGMRGGNQGKIVADGNVHLDAEFPNLDRLHRAFIITDRPSQPGS